MVDRSLLPPVVQDARGLAFMELCNTAATIPVATALLYWIDQAPAVVLPELALQFGVLGDAGWSLASTVLEQRALLKDAFALHRKKGTPWSIKRALALVGWPGITLQEGLPGIEFNGARVYDGSFTYAGPRWALFTATQPYPNKQVSAQDLATIKAAINYWKPLRCILDSVDFTLAFTSTIVAGPGSYGGGETYNGWNSYNENPLPAITQIGVGQGAPSSLYPIPAGGVDTSVPGQITINWVLDTAEGNGKNLDTFSLFTAAGTEVTRVTHGPILKTSDMSLSGTWIVNYH